MRISIVTPTHVSGGFLDQAIASVPRWSAGDVEHIVVHDLDNASAAALRARYPHLKLLPGNGTGSTAALAIGFAAASGNFVLELNSDDRLVAGAFDHLLARASERPDIDTWTGGTRIFRMNAAGAEVTVRRIVSRAATALTLPNIFDDLPLMTARFIRRSVFEKLGNLDPQFPESSDREFMIRTALAGVSEASLGTMVSELRQHGASHTMNPVRSVVPRYLHEHLRIADMWLARPDLSSTRRTEFRNWRAREAIRLAVLQLRAGDWRSAAQTVAQEATTDRLWWVRTASSVAAWRRRRRS